jgi:prohibitin 2
METGLPKELKIALTVAGVIAGLIILWALAPIAVVPTGFRGVMTTFGKPSDRVYPEGIHWRTPIADTMNLVNVQLLKAESVTDAASKDLQQVTTKIALNFHIDPPKVVYVYRELRSDVESRIIDPSVHEAVKAVTARYTAEELISKRAVVRDEIVAVLRDRFSRHGIVIDEFSIMNFNFSSSFNSAIEAKTTAEQLKLKAERDLQRIQVEAEQKIASARAEAESLRLQKQEITSELLKLREIEMQTKAVEKWDGKLPSTVAGGSVPFLNLK